MILINLLPHREAARQRRTRRFHVQLLLSVLLGGLVSALVFVGFEHRAERQRARNQFLQQEMARLEGEAQSLARLQKERDALLRRLLVLESLQAQRKLPVQLLQELALQTPAGVQLNSLRQDQQHILLAGFAQSQERVTELMHNLGSSDWLGRPELVEIVATPDSRPDPQAGGGLSSFTVRVTLGLVGSSTADLAGAEPRVSTHGPEGQRP